MKKLLLATAAFCVFSTGSNACGTTIPRVCYSRIYDNAHLGKHPDQTVSAMRIALSGSIIAEGLSDFDLSVQFREEHDKWQWATGTCYRFGPGMTCVEILDGCDTSESNHFYITQNPNTLYLYPSRINLHRGDSKEEMIRSDKRILNEGKDDKIFRLDKTACWKLK
jgi:hypothetical protein